jgi:hypothetical protein
MFLVEKEGKYQSNASTEVTPLLDVEKYAQHPA